MMDLYMVASLAVIYGLFYGFMHWCADVVEEKGRDSL